MKIWSPYEKYRQVRKEAGATGGLLVLLILFWCFAGFGLAGVDAEIFGLPLWAVMGSIGVWAFAIIGVMLLVRGVFRDMPLEEDGAENSEMISASHAEGGAEK